MKQLVPLTVNAPGSFGLNKKNERLDIGAQWCTTAKNAVVSSSGVLEVRKGWSPVNSTAITGSPNPRSIFEYINSTGTSRILTAAGNKIWEGTATLTDVTSLTAPTADNWKFVNFNNKVVGVQAGHQPIVKSGTGAFADINFSGSTINKPYEALSGWGRVWYVDADGKTIFWSDLLNEAAVSGSTAPGSAGTLNLTTVWGGDEIVALAAFQDFLVIFGREHIVLYDGPEDPNSTLKLAEIIYGTGCIARDSVQNTGNDILFLSTEGITSLSRNLESGSLPLINMSENVRGYLTLFSSDETEANIKSVWDPEEGVYLLSLPGNDKVFYFNFKFRTPENLPRVTDWMSLKPTALCMTRDGTLYLGKPGYLAKYDTYQDNGASYHFEMETGWDPGQDQTTVLNKIPKHAFLTVSGGYNAAINLTWSFDYGLYRDSGLEIVDIGVSPSEWGVSEYGTAEYSGLSFVTTLRYRLSGSGRAIRYGIHSTIDGSNFVVQRIDVFAKMGRVI